MSHLRTALADYLTLRRALGYKMDKAERLVGQFTAFAEERGETHIRTETALVWATEPAGAAAIWTSRRLAEVRLFARHLQTLDPRTEVPPRDLLPAQARRATPYLYTPQEIAALMQATAILRGSHVQATYRTLIGLLAATGMRIGEAIGLDRDDFDAGSGMVTGRALSRDALEHRLAKYVQNASSACPSLAQKSVTMHVLRHSAAMRLLQAGIDTSVIALWLGHEQIETTQIYLHADLQIKERALEKTAPITTKPGRFRPTDKLLAFLEAL